MEKKNFIWDYIAWIILILIFIWLILKVTGVIKTPLWFQYSPLFGAIYLAGWAMHKLDRATDDIREIKEDVKEVESNMNILRTNCPELNPTVKKCKGN